MEGGGGVTDRVSSWSNREKYNDRDCNKECVGVMVIQMVTYMMVTKIVTEMMVKI